MDFQFSKSANTIIKVLGVGGGGGNAVTHMFHQGIHDVSFALCNTDQQALNKSPIPHRIQLGKTITEGLGAGNKPEIARQAAEESEDEIRDLLNDGTKMVFITAGMGGGTGTGAAPVIARIARSMNILTVGIVTIPFYWEGAPKIIQALNGVEEMSKYVDALLVVNNDRLYQIYPKLLAKEGFAKADDTLSVAAKSIAEIITIEGYINLDFADVRTTLKDGGIAIMSTGTATGEKRITHAIENALHSPLLNNNDVFSAKRILINFTFNDVIMEELKEVNEFMEKFSNEINVIWGANIDESVGDEVKVSLLATGFDLTNVPGILENREKKTQEQLQEEEKQRIEAERKKMENLERISKVYGSSVTSKPIRRSTPIILNTEQLDDEEVIRLMEVNPTSTRSAEVTAAIKEALREKESNGVSLDGITIKF